MIKKTLTEEKNIFIVLFIYAFLLIFFCSMMSPLYPINDWSDINLYFNMGKAMFHGRTLYTEVFDHKGPFIFVIYGIGSLFSGSSFIGMYFIESLCWVLMIFAAYLTARLYFDKIYAFVVALVFPVLVLSHTSQGGSAEEFIIIFEAISLYFFVRYFKEKDAKIHKPAYMAVHGAMCAMVLLTKINLVVFWFFPLLAVFITLILNKEYRNLIQNIIAFLIGILIIALPICLYLLINGALSEAWDIYINLNRSYARIGGLGGIIEGLVVRFYLRLRFETFEFLIILTGAFYFPLKYIGNKWGRISIMLSFVALYLAIFVTPGYVYYYSIPYYIYAVLGLIVLCNFLKLPSTRKFFAICFALALIWGINQKNFYQFPLNDLFTRKEQPNLINRFAKIIEKEKNPTLMNIGLDSNNAIFTKLGLVPNVKYFVTPNLAYDIYPQMRDEQTRYIEDKEVQFIILPEAAMTFDYFFNLPALNENYELVDKFVSDEGNRRAFYLYKRKDN